METKQKVVEMKNYCVDTDTIDELGLRCPMTNKLCMQGVCMMWWHHKTAEGVGFCLYVASMAEAVGVGADVRRTIYLSAVE